MSADEPKGPPSAGESVWAQYSKERYEAAQRRLADFRGWARQLVTAVAVVVGLEATLLAQLLRLVEIPVLGLGICLVIVLGGIGYHLVILASLVGKGYVGQESLGPESPQILADHVGDEAATRRMIGAYYAKAADVSHARAENVTKEIAALAKRFIKSLWLLFAAMALTATLQVLSSGERKVMPDNPGSSDSAPASPAPSTPAAAPATPSAPPPASTGPATSPLLATPTPGQLETLSQQPPRQNLLATPTPGQRVTEAQGGKKK